MDDNEVDRALKILGLVLAQNSGDAVGRRYPAFLLVALTHAGMRGWEEGTFYAKVAQTLGTPKDRVEEATRAYHEALMRFGMARFDQAGGCGGSRRSYCMGPSRWTIWTNYWICSPSVGAGIPR